MTTPTRTSVSASAGTHDRTAIDLARVPRMLRGLNLGRIFRDELSPDAALLPRPTRRAPRAKRNARRTAQASRRANR